MRSCDSVMVSADDMMHIVGSNVTFNLYMPGCIRHLSLSDFRKMLTILSNQLYPDDFLKCLRLWDEAVARIGDIPVGRMNKLTAIIYKKLEKLPAWVFEDFYE